MNAITETDLAVILEQAATTFLPSVTTLETRNSDNADFHEVAAWERVKLFVCGANSYMYLSKRSG